ncbi:hypothetical protein EG240_15150 [Paenimyroides tangerinum]|uniref:Uncharacterized protein n=1 Tax=Paenimyroides tangerinum TaxID=2488728 RepID=A0A3P3VY17_9FLAO|nr:hypothetical protein EG240_15150 [Paenimyroides tangerinum]
MGFFNAKTTWANKEFILFKLCVASIYTIVGSYFHRFFENYYLPLFVLFGITMIWTVTLWLRKMKHKS